MSERIHVLAQQLFDKASVEECNLDEIRELVQQYPYFAPARFLLLEKLKLEISPDYPKQLQKSVLYYHNPVEFEYFISSERFEIEKIEDPPGNNLISLDVNATVNEADAPLVFEPFHTVDYFASQGIRFTHENAPNDKFGKQLKSFTEWLKTMKKLPAREINSQVDDTSEKNVQHLAEDSVHESDVVTEAMAEVWLKQGNPQKALEIYNKLYLQNPSKKAYFAALIENLKT